MRSLALYGDYSQEEVQQIFGPDATFTPQAGTWGRCVSFGIPDRPAYAFSAPKRYSRRDFTQIQFADFCVRGWLKLAQLILIYQPFIL